MKIVKIIFLAFGIVYSSPVTTELTTDNDSNAYESEMEVNQVHDYDKLWCTGTVNLVFVNREIVFQNF